MTMLLLNANLSLAQMNYWVTPPNAIDFTQSPTSAAPIPNAPSNPYIVSNGAYDADGNLLFYVIDGNVYKPNGSWAGQLPYTGNFALEYISPEMAIVPIPGECYRFNIIYLLAAGPPSGAALFFTQVDASNGNVVMCDPPNPLVDTYSGSITGSLTVSARINQLGGRWLYVVIGGYGVMKYNVGVTVSQVQGNPIYNNQLIGGWLYEAWEVELLEIPEETKRLVWVSPMAQDVFFSISIDNFGNFDGELITYQLPQGINRLAGVEFSEDGEYIYCSAGGNNGTIGGVYRFLTGATSTPVFVTGSNNHNRTHLELGKDGFIYGVNQTGGLGRILSGGTVLQNYSMGITLRSNAPLPTHNSDGVLFSLPDQIDREDYDNFNGLTPLNISDLVVTHGGGSILNNQCHDPGIVFNCNPFGLIPTITGGPPAEYRLQIQAVNNDCEVVLGMGLNYNSGWMLSYPLQDLRELEDASGLSMGNSLGRFKITLSVRNDCEEVSAQGYVRVNGTPSPATVDLTINSYLNPGIPVPPSTSLPGVSVGAYTAGFNINNSTGDISFYTLRVVQVDCTSGSLIQEIYPETTVEVSGVTGLVALSLNTLNVPPIPALGWSGGQGFFGAQGMNNCYRMQVTIGNACNSSSQWSYLSVNCVCFDDPGLDDRSAGVGNSLYQDEVLLFPNPVHSVVQLKHTASVSGQGALQLFDGSGRLVYSQELSVQVGEQQHEWNMEDQAAGLYHYRLISPSGNFSGRFVKAD